MNSWRFKRPFTLEKLHVELEIRLVCAGAYLLGSCMKCHPKRLQANCLIFMKSYCINIFDISCSNYFIIDLMTKTIPIISINIDSIWFCSTYPSVSNINIYCSIWRYNKSRRSCIPKGTLQITQSQN